MRPTIANITRSLSHSHSLSLSLSLISLYMFTCVFTCTSCRSACVHADSAHQTSFGFLRQPWASVRAHSTRFTSFGFLRQPWASVITLAAAFSFCAWGNRRRISVPIATCVQHDKNHQITPLKDCMPSQCRRKQRRQHATGPTPLK